MTAVAWDVHAFGRSLRDDRSLTVYAKAVLFVLATHADKRTGHVASRWRVSFDLLAVEGGMSRRSAANAVRDAEAAGWLIVHAPSKADARRNRATSAYTLCIPPAASSAHGALVQVHEVQETSAHGARKTTPTNPQGHSASAGPARPCLPEADADVWEGIVRPAVEARVGGFDRHEESTALGLYWSYDTKHPDVIVRILVATIEKERGR